MSDVTKIGWVRNSDGSAGSTFNPWIGCEPVSPGCAHCYAAAFAKRTGRDFSIRQRTSDANWRKPIAWNADAMARGIRRRVFCLSLGDVADAGAEWESFIELIILIDSTPDLDWLLLSKRSKALRDRLQRGTRANVWAGATMENQDMADARGGYLWETNAAKRFISVEPMLGHVRPRLDGIDWVICGAESGPHARPMNEDWVRSLRDQCVKASVPFFYKQKIVAGRKVELPDLDGRVWQEMPR